MASSRTPANSNELPKAAASVGVEVNSLKLPSFSWPVPPGPTCTLLSAEPVWFRNWVLHSELGKAIAPGAILEAVTEPFARSPVATVLFLMSLEETVPFFKSLLLRLLFFTSFVVTVPFLICLPVIILAATAAPPPTSKARMRLVMTTGKNLDCAIRLPSGVDCAQPDNWASAMPT